MAKSSIYKDYKVPEYGLTPPLVLRSCMRYFLLLFYMASLYSCKKMEPDPMLSEKFERAIIQNTSGYISLDTVINGFEWDKMLIKVPYISPLSKGRLQKQIDNLYQLDLSENDDTDGLNYLIFVSGIKAVAYCKIAQGPCCVFYGIRGGNPFSITKEEAVFKIVKTRYKTMTQHDLLPKPLSKLNSK